MAFAQTDLVLDHLSQENSSKVPVLDNINRAGKRQLYAGRSSDGHSFKIKIPFLANDLG